MNWSIRFAYFGILYGLVPLLCLAAWYRWKFYKAPVYIYSLTGQLKSQGLVVNNWRKTFFAVTRCVVLVSLALLIARPQLVDEQSKVMVEGIDIMMVLDVSGSMQIIDDPQSRRQRVEVAKEEAINFINKRDNDPIGLVLFGGESVSRCPLTLDKTVLKSIIADIELGVISPQGTVLSKGIITALGRLKGSDAKTKIIILLTDG
jgi:Ca-activated chloride channel family protein